MKIELTVKYRTPSLNVTKRQHWTAQFKEKRKAFNALSLALRDFELSHSTLITSQEASRICSTALDTLVCYLEMSRGGFTSKQSNKKSATSKMKKP